MKIENAIEIGEKAHPITGLKAPKMKIKEIKQMIMIWPAIILANKRIIKANGFVNTPNISTIIRIGLIP